MAKKTLPIDTSAHRVILLFALFSLLFNFIVIFSAAAPKPETVSLGAGLAAAFFSILSTLFGLGIGSTGLIVAYISISKNKKLKQTADKRASWYVFFYIVVLLTSLTVAMIISG